MEDQIWECLLNRLNRTETAESKLILDRWLATNGANLKQYDEVKLIWELTGKIKPETPILPFNQFIEQLDAKPAPVTKKLGFWKLGIAASLIGVFLFSALYYYQSKQNQPLTWVVKKAVAGKMLKISLPDSSTVWLNSGSELSYVQQFTQQKLRAVNLKGEAYFEVKHDEEHPFVVKAEKLTTTVYGTSFSVRAYQNENLTSVAVNSGKVGVTETTNPKGNQPIMLLPNDQLSYNKSEGGFVKTTVANETVNGWIDGEIVFEQTSVDEVLETLGRKYNVKIETEGNTYTNCKLTARFKNEPIEAVLNVLKLSLNIKSTQIKQTIYLKGGNCM